ncbi:MAG: hypothetical protein SVG88_12550 [Halobacteriales archaeon]|nr:hypothetical protein [Halobacteriales archaeon]
MTQQRLLTRRIYLMLAGAGLSALAGCGGSDDNSGAGTQTATATKTPPATPTTTPPPTDTPTPTATATPTPTPEQSQKIRRLETQLSKVSFQGEYFDTHAHWLPSMGPKIPSQYAAMMQQHGIGAAVLFSPSRDAVEQYQRFLKTLTAPDVEYLPFMSAPPPGKRLGTELRRLYDGKEKAFWGIGEWKPQQKPAPPFNGKRYTPLWELSADLGIPVMFHPKAPRKERWNRH